MIIGRKPAPVWPALVVLSLILTACGSPAATTPTVSPVTATPTTSPATVTPTVSLPADAFDSTDVPPRTPSPDNSLLTFPIVNCCRGRGIEPGIYELPKWLEMPLSVEVGEGWKFLNEKDALLFLIGRGLNVQNNPSQMIVFMKVSSDMTPETLIQAIRDSPELVSAEESTVEVAGFPGLQLDSTAKPNPEYVGNSEADIPPGVQFLPVFTRHFSPGFSWTTSSVEAQIRTIALMVDDQVLLLYLEAPQGEFDSLISDAEVILQSLKLISR
jgi:hypothetical protein